MLTDTEELKETIDLIVSQALERYNEMLPDEAHEAIIAEWDEQMAEVFEALIFKTTCTGSHCMTEFVEMERENGNGIYFVPICGCEWDEWRKK